MAQPKLPRWDTALLKAGGFPVTPQNLRFVDAWQQAEGGSAANNPFNTTEPGFGATGDYNQVGVKNYPTPRQGLAATVATLENGRYGSIVDALRQGSSAMAAAQALAASPWGTGSLVEKILGGPAAAPAAGAPSGSALARSAAQTAAPAVATPSRVSLLGPLSAASGSGDYTQFFAALGNALRNQGATASLPVSPAPAAVGQAAPVQPLPSSSKLALAAVPLNLATRKGIGLDQQVLPEAERIAQQFGVKVNSGYRSPAHNAQVGGAQGSDHLTGDAVDFTGSPAAMQALQQWALRQRFPYVEPWSQTGGSHVHISLRRTR